MRTGVIACDGIKAGAWHRNHDRRDSLYSSEVLQPNKNYKYSVAMVRTEIVELSIVPHIGCDHRHSNQNYLCFLYSCF